MIGLKEIFRLMYSNTHLKSRETLPLICQKKTPIFTGLFVNEPENPKARELIHARKTQKSREIILLSWF